MLKKITLLVFIAAFFLTACEWIKGNKFSVQRDLSINTLTSFNNLFLDSSSIDKFIALHPEFSGFLEEYKAFYLHRNFEYAWFDSAGLSEQAHNFYNLQSNYISSMSDSSIYSRSLNKLFDSLMSRKKNISVDKKQVQNIELLLTGQFFKYSAKVYKGSDIKVDELGWFIPRKKIDLSALLDSMIVKKAENPDQYALLNKQYKELEKQLILYLEKDKKELSDTIPNVQKPIKKGYTGRIVFLIKQRLNLLQESSTLDSTNLFDSKLVTEVMRFQKRHGLSVDGSVGNKMIEELNVPVKKRIQQILVNMERARWMPQESDSNYVVVNIPEYKLHIYDSGKQVIEMNVIVGSTVNNTVIFNGKLQYIVFSPYWNVPESIVKKEIMPLLAKNPNYITKNNMEITGYNGKTPIVRQKPGDKNSLGHVKFLFPNNYNIYFHDTPNRDLFEQSGRNLSHGCIRLQYPKKFAQYLLRNDTVTWNNQRIDTLMHNTKERWVTLKKPLPVFLVYFTAWVDMKGLLNFRKDIYKHDEKMTSKLFNK